jgi:hypothetical protein
MADLTTLAVFKRHARIASTDTTLDQLIDECIDATSEAIEGYCDRRFGAEDYVEWFRANATVRVRHWPLIYVNSLHVGLRQAISIRYTGSRPIAAAQVYADGVRLQSVDSDGTTSSDNLTFATYPTLSTMATAINAVTNWSGTLLGANGWSETLYPTAMPGSTTTRVLYCGDDQDVSYYVRHDTGEVCIAPLGSTADVVVRYRSGYDTIPRDVQQVANELVSRMLAAGTTNANLASESIGDYSYSMLAAEPAWTQRLDPYRRLR